MSGKEQGIVDVDEHVGQTMFVLEGFRVLQETMEDLVEQHRVNELGEIHGRLCQGVGLLEGANAFVDRVLIGCELPLRVRYALTTQLYSILESRIVALCEEYARRTQQIVQIDDMKDGRSLGGAYTYLTKIAKLQWDNYEQFRCFGSLRNLLVHRDGVPKGGDKNIAERMKGIAGVELSPWGDAFIAKKAIQKVYQDARALFTNLFHQLGWGPVFTRCYLDRYHSFIDFDVRHAEGTAQVNSVSRPG